MLAVIQDTLFPPKTPDRLSLANQGLKTQVHLPPYSTQPVRHEDVVGLSHKEGRRNFGNFKRGRY